MEDTVKKIYKFILNLFTEHPRECDEHYVVHMYYALKISIICMLSSILLVIHSVFPFLFKRTSGHLIEYALEIRNRSRCEEEYHFDDNFNDMF